jgi:hypothetical protein
MAKKIDFDFKQFMLDKGERFGMGVAVGLMVLLIILGVFSGLGKTSPLPKLKENAEKLDMEVRRTAPTTIPINEPPKGVKSEWEKPDQEALPVVEWLIRQNMENLKRRNPPIRALTAYQVNVAKLPVQTISFLDGEKVEVLVSGANAETTGDPTFAEKNRPIRLVIISAVFPYAQQLDDFKTALRLGLKSKKKRKGDKKKDKDEAAEEAPPVIKPKFKGLFVYRRTTLPNGQVKKWPLPGGKAETEWEYIDLAEQVEVKSGKKKGTKLVYKPSKFRTLMSTSPAVDPRDKKLGEVVLPGLVMPRPALMGGSYYPPVELPSSKNPKEISIKDPELIVKGPPAQDGMTVEQKDITSRSFPKKWRQRLKGDFDVFDPRWEGKEEDDAAPPERGKGKIDPRMGLKPPVGPGGRPDNGDDEDEDKAKTDDKLVRFIDVDVEPGHTYEYSIVVRVANPNFRKDKLVAAKMFARVKELYSPYNYIPPVTVPYDTQVYAVDELALRPGKDGFSKRGNNMLVRKEREARKSLNPAGGGNGVAVQIHRWVDEVTNPAFSLGEWLVAERVLVRPGEFIGRDVEVQVPKWNLENQSYDILYPPKVFNRGKPKEKRVPEKGVDVDFTAKGESELPAALLVDFSGGPRQQMKVGNERPGDSSATELLILEPDGKLVVRNNLEDSDPSTPRGRERAERHQEWKDRIEKLNGTEKKAPDKKGKKGALDKDKDKKKKKKKGQLDK